MRSGGAHWAHLGCGEAHRAAMTARSLTTEPRPAGIETRERCSPPWYILRADVDDSCRSADGGHGFERGIRNGQAQEGPYGHRRGGSTVGGWRTADPVRTSRLGRQTVGRPDNEAAGHPPCVRHHAGEQRLFGHLRIADADPYLAKTLPSKGRCSRSTTGSDTSPTTTTSDSSLVSRPTPTTSSTASHRVTSTSRPGMARRTGSSRVRAVSSRRR